MNVAELPLFLTADEFADIIRCNRKTVYEGVKDGTIPAVRLGRAIRIPRAAIAEMARESADLEPGSP